GGAAAEGVGTVQDPLSRLALDQGGDPSTVVIDLGAELVLRDAGTAQGQRLAGVEGQEGDGASVGEFDRRREVAKQLSITPDVGGASSGSQGEQTVRGLVGGTDPAQAAIAGSQAENQVGCRIRGRTNAAGLTAVGQEMHVDAVGDVAGADQLGRSRV